MLAPEAAVWSIRTKNMRNYTPQLLNLDTVLLLVRNYA